MQFLQKLIPSTIRAFIILSCTFAFSLWGCTSMMEEKNWLAAVPAYTPALITPDSDADISSILESDFIPFLDDISSSAIPIAGAIQSQTGTPVTIRSLLIFPTTADDWQPVWIGEADQNFLKRNAEHFYKPFTQNDYSFKGQTIYKLHIGERALYASQLHQWLLLSESSYGIEESIRSYLGIEPSLQLSSEELTANKLVLNTPYLDRWVRQLSQVAYRPNTENIFDGSEPVILNVEQAERDSTKQLGLQGTIPLTQNNQSPLISAISYDPADLELDRYISSNAAAFGIFRLPPKKLPESVSNSTPLDSLLYNDEELYNRLYETLGTEFALVMYEESGYLSEGEYLWIRHLSDYREFYQILRELSRDGYIDRTDDVFHVSSSILGRLISSELGTLEDFYLGTSWKGAIISKRKGLTESVKSDRSRRRVIYYDEQYMKLKENWPTRMSGFVMANSNRLLQFVEPFLTPDHYVDAITSKFDILTMTFQQTSIEDGQGIAFNLSTYNRESNNLPYEERWIYPFNNVELSGDAILADIGGSARNEVLFATTGGQVIALASDGTTVLETSTQTDTPIGSPVVYDWYGNGQDAIMIAAGNKIYAWNTAGEMLPKFPFELDEQITTPLNVVDVTRDGIPEIAIGTADRKVHVLDGRGNDIEGWPHTTNTALQTAPVFRQVEDNWSVWAFSGNTLHAWNQDGIRRPGFPKFINASFTGQPVTTDSHIFGNSADGNLYTFGTHSIINDSLNVYRTDDEGVLNNLTGKQEPDSVQTEAVYVSNTSLTGTPQVRQLVVRDNEDKAVNETIYLTLSSNGSVFVLNEKGQLRYTQSMGQPAADRYSPQVHDIYKDGRPEIISLASFGRLYAWEVLSDKRMYSLPTTAMEHPVFADLDSDGYTELIAQTRDGLRCWTLSDSE